MNIEEGSDYTSRPHVHLKESFAHMRYGSKSSDWPLWVVCTVWTLMIGIIPLAQLQYLLFWIHFVDENQSGS